MDRKKKAQAVFAKLLNQKANKTCIDCSAFNPQWASVTCACFFCIKCAGTHRSLGVHLTFVRSVSMDEWSDQQLACMKAGGNAKLREFWSSQGFPTSISSKEKYDNDAMDAYRDYIKQASQGGGVNEIPHIGYTKRVRKARNFGQQSFGGNSMGGMGNSNSLQGGSRRKRQDDPWADFTSGLGSAMGNLGTSVNSGLSQVSTRAQQIDTSQLKSQVASGWGNFTSWVTDTASKATSSIQDFAQQDEQDDISAVLRRNLGNSGRKMESLSSSNPPRRSSNSRSQMQSLSSDSQQNRPRKKMASLSSQNYFDDTPKSPPQRSRKKMASLSSDTMGMKEDSLTTKQDEEDLDDFFGRKRSSKADEDLDDFGFDASDSESSHGNKHQVLDKITKVSDDEDVDFDDWGWEEGAKNAN